MDDLVEKRAAMREQIARLAEMFLKRCSGDIGLLRGLLARLRTGDAAAFKELEYLAHRLCGTGALLGFASIGTCAGTIERLAQASPGNATPDPDVIARLTEYTARLATEIDLLAQTQG